MIPSLFPANATATSAQTSTNFKGLLHVNPATGIVSVTDAHPAGTYTVTVNAFNGIGTASANFQLIVNHTLCSQGLFGTNINLPSGTGPLSVAVADFNNDGRQDIACANSGSNSVSIRLGNGTGGFTNASDVTFSVNLNASSIAVGDFNGDGKQDFLVADGGYPGQNVLVKYGNGTGGFTGNTIVQVGLSPTSIDIGDFNGDGKQDFAAACYWSNSVSIGIGDGNGGFNTMPGVMVGANPLAVKIGDFNGDTKQDIAVVNYISNTVSIRLGNGLGGFAGSTEINAGTNPYSVAIGDLNGDGKQDLAIANKTSNNVSIRLGDGTGGFIQAADIPLSNYAPQAIVIGDFNGDANPDIAMADGMYSSAAYYYISVRLGNGTGNFSGTTDLVVGNNPLALAVADFNGDGRLDLVTANRGSNNISIRLGGAGAISVKGNNVAIVDGSNAPETNNHTDFGLSVARNFTIQNTGTGGLTVNSIHVNGADSSLFTISGITLPVTIDGGTSTTFAIRFSPTSAGLKTTTVNIGTNTCYQPIFRFAVQGTGAPATLGNYPATTINTAGGNAVVNPSTIPAHTASIAAYTTADFKGMLYADPITGVVKITNAHPAGIYTVTVKAFNGVAASTTTFKVTVNNTLCSQALYGGTTNVAVSTNPRSLAVGDFNGDGKQDFAAANFGASTVSIRLGDGAGSFSGSITVAVGTNPYGIAVADFNGDGHQDFATANFNGSSVSVQLGNGTGGFNAAANIVVAGNPRCITTGDFNNDGRTDLAVGHYAGSGTVSICQGNGDGSFGTPNSVAVGAYPISVIAADFNGDGNPDFAVANNLSNINVSIRMGDGTGSFTNAPDIATGSSPYSVTTGDFNSDGKQDIAVANYNSATVSIRLGNGAGGFTGTTDVLVGTGPVSVTAGDFNGDGSQDIAVLLNNTTAIAIRLGDGVGGFTASTSVTVASNPYQMVLGDVNGDGKQDFLAACNSSNSVSIRMGSPGFAEINVQGNNTSITDGDIAPSVTDFTDFGNVNTNLERIFTIQNTGSGSLLIKNIRLSGLDSSMFSVYGITIPVTIAAGTSAQFTTRFLPGSAGLKTAIINIVSDDCDEANYDFSIQGTGVGTSPGLGNYPNSSIANAGRNIFITPTAPPTNASGVTAFARGNFKGVLHTNPTTGVITVTNAHPAGIYTITVNALNGFSKTTTSFTLTVNQTQCSQALFSTATNIPLGNSPQMVAIGDFNNDGKQDFAAPNSNSNTISIQLGNGLGSFSNTSDVTTVHSPSAVSIGDINADGKQDLIVGNNGNNSLSIYLGNGDGSFSFLNTVSAGVNPWAVLLHDFNSDGRLDIASTNAGSDNISIRLGNGLGGFIASSEVATGSGPRFFAIGDINNDGRQDFVIPNYLDNSVSIRLGDGLGGFSITADMSLGTSPSSVVIDDFNSDGNQDIAVARIGGISIRLGDGTGNFSGANEITGSPVSLATGDFNGDGKADITAANYNVSTVATYLGNGAGGFTSNSNLNLGYSPYFVSVADVNNDGKQDILSVDGNTPGSVSIILANPNSAEINLLGNNTTILQGDNTPSLSDYTDFGNVNTNLIRNFTIQNTSTGSLKINSIGTRGSDSSLFNVSGIIFPVVLASNASTTFTVSFVPTTPGLKTAAITINNDDCDEPAYNFSIQGTAVALLATLGNYPANTNVVSGKNINITPSATPTNATNITAYTSGNFKGLLRVNPSTGVVAVVNAHPAGVYNVTVKVNGVATSSASFVLTVTNPICSQVLTSSAFTSVSQVNGILAATVGDFNGDGMQDVATANYTNSTVNIRLGNVNGSFTGSTDIAVGSNPYSIVINDFNGDGNLDFATANYGANTVSVRLGDGAGNFPGSTIVGVGAAPYSIAAADINKDGKQDIITPNYMGNTASVRLGDGTGGFYGSYELSLPAGPISVAIDDVNGDGNPDIAIANYNNNSVSVRLGDGSGAFSGLLNIAVGAKPRAVAISDLNQDGKPDIVAANQNSASVSVSLGDGTGAFATPVQIPIGSNPYGLAISDFNGDGKPDIVVPNYNIGTVSVRLGDALGNFSELVERYVTTGITSLAVGNFNADNIMDIVVTGRSYNYSTGNTDNYLVTKMGGVGDISVTANSSNILDGDTIPSIADNTDFGTVATDTTMVKSFYIYNSGYAELKVKNITVTGPDSALFKIGEITFPRLLQGNDVNWFTISFKTTSAGLKKATINIINDDCDESIFDFAIQANGTAAAPALGSYMNTTIASAGGNGIVTPSAPPANSKKITASANNNFKGNLLVDSATGALKISNAHPAGSYTVTIKAFNGTAISLKTFTLTVVDTRCSQALFSSNANVGAGVGSNTVVVGDFNGDGMQDIAAANAGSSDVSIRLGSGSGAFSGVTNVPVGAHPSALALVDFNGDGKLDLATANSFDNTVSIRLGNGAGGFSGSTNVSVGSSPKSIAIGDFNGDGITDFATANDSSHSASIRLGDSTGGFRGTTEIPVGSNPVSIAISDVNRDGNSDIATANYGSGTVSICLGNGSGGFGAATNHTVGGQPRSISFGNFNGTTNGSIYQDIAVTSSDYNGSVTVRLNDGTGNFGTLRYTILGTIPYAAAIGDFNGDGLQDFATTNFNSNNVSMRLGDGAGNFNGNINEAVGANPSAIAVGDFNADGLQDFATANQADNNFSVRVGGANDINLKGNNTNITDGDNIPSITDHSDFGTVGSILTRTFSIHNSGSTNLTINNIAISGTHTSLFQLIGISVPKSIASGDSAVFKVSFAPTSSGLKTATISITSDDCDEALFDFAIQGTGVSNSVTIGSYPSTTIVTSGANAIVAASAAPTNAAGVVATTSASFQGLLVVDPATGTVTITNARPGGTYTVTVKSYNGSSTATTTFILTVSNALCNKAQFGNPIAIPTAAGPNIITLGDFNGDARLDLIVNTGIYLGSGTGNFSQSGNLNLAGASSIVVGDFNGDGKQDIAGGIAGTGRVGIRFGDGTGNFGGNAEINVGGNGGPVITADVNNDGISDIIAGNGNTSLAVRLGDGYGGFYGSFSVVVQSASYALAVADFNGDGKTDIASANFSAKTISIRLGDGMGNFTGTSNVVVSDYPSVLKVADFNMDGKPDMVVGFNNNVSGGVSVLMGDGTGLFAAPVSLTTIGATQSVEVADFNGDGNQDIAKVDYQTSLVWIYLGANNGIFNQYSFINNPGPRPLVALAGGDFNNDGLYDFATANLVANQVSINLGSTTEINLQGNNTGIPDGDNIPSITDGTDFGTTNAGGTVVRNYTIQNTGAVNLTISNIKITGADSLMFTTGGITLPASIIPGASQSFTVTFNPSTAGLKAAIVNVYTDDCDEANYDFAIQGGIAGEGLDFDGTNDHITINNTAGNFGLSNATISAWIKTTDTSASSILSKRDVCGQGNFIDFGISATGRVLIELEDAAGSANQALNSKKIVNDGLWHHVAAVRIGTTLSLFIDGMLDTTTTSIAIANINNTAPLMIGASGCSNSAINFFSGQMDELRFWNTALTNCEIQNGMQCELVGSQSGLLAYYKFNQGRALDNNEAVVVLPDSSGNGNAGTLNNFTLAGTISNWISGSAVTAGVSCNNTNTWLGLSANWSLATNWSRGFVPLECTNVIINNGVAFMPEVSDPASTCYSLKLNNGATVTVKGSGKLDITGKN